MNELILYSTSACHLCELAQEMIAAQWAETSNFVLEVVDISESDILFECYGLRIPVLRHLDGRELSWPFTPLQLRDFLTS